MCRKVDLSCPIRGRVRPHAEGAAAPHGQEQIARPAREKDRRNRGASKTGSTPAAARPSSRAVIRLRLASSREEAAAGAAHEVAEDRLGEPVHHRQHGVEFDRKPAVRRRHEHRAPGDPAAFAQQAALPLERADMLDHRGGVDDVEGGVARTAGRARPPARSACRDRASAGTRRRRARAPSPCLCADTTPRDSSRPRRSARRSRRRRARCRSRRRRCRRGSARTSCGADARRFSPAGCRLRQHCTGHWAQRLA